MYLTQPSRRDTAHIHHTMKYFGIFLCSSLLMTSCATESPAYTTETVIINKSFNAVSVINLLNILGWGIDAATGAMTKPEFKFYQIDFQPKEEKSIKQD